MRGNKPSGKPPHECKIGDDGFCHNYEGHEVWLVCSDCGHRGLIMKDASRDLDMYPDVMSCPGCGRQNIEVMPFGTRPGDKV